jgi:hypothetical protein
VSYNQESYGNIRKISATTKEAFVRLEQQHPYFRSMYLREIKKDIGMNRFIRSID